MMSNVPLRSGFQTKTKNFCEGLELLYECSAKRASLNGNYVE